LTIGIQFMRESSVMAPNGPSSVLEVLQMCITSICGLNMKHSLSFFTGSSTVYSFKIKT
jgi:hypothetical protein